MRLKLTHAVVRAIIADYETGMKAVEIASARGMCERTVYSALATKEVHRCRCGHRHERIRR